MGLFGFGKSKEQKIFERATNELNRHLSFMMNKTDLNFVLTRNAYARRDIEDRLGVAILQHQSLCYTVWMGNQADELNAIVLGMYREHVFNLMSECRNFTPKDNDRLQNELEACMKESEHDPEGRKFAMMHFLLSMSKEKSREWFVGWLGKSFDVSESELISIGAGLMGEFEKVWDESANMVKLFLS